MEWDGTWGGGIGWDEGVRLRCMMGWVRVWGGGLGWDGMGVKGWDGVLG